MPKRIVSFGEVMMRLQVPGYALLQQANTLNYTFAGTGVNVAAAMGMLGHDGYLVTRLPDNAVGGAANSFIQQLGIRDAYISRGGSYLGMYFLENGFGNRANRVTYTNRRESSFNTATPNDYDFDEIANCTDVIHFCGIALAMTDQVRENMKTLAKKVQEKGGLVCFDCNYRPSLWEGGYEQAKPHYETMLALSDIVMMNEQDALNILGMYSGATTRDSKLRDVIPEVAEKYHIQIIAGTHRDVRQDHHKLKGFMYKAGKWEFSREWSFPVYDRIGSGDAFTAGILHGYLQGFSSKQMVQFATCAGMLACTIMGDTPLSTEADIFQAMSGAIEDVKR